MPTRTVFKIKRIDVHMWENDHWTGLRGTDSTRHAVRWTCSPAVHPQTRREGQARTEQLPDRGFHTWRCAAVVERPHMPAMDRVSFVLSVEPGTSR
jgi:hypothetical protein